jgi:hypothetical protein
MVRKFVGNELEGVEKYKMECRITDQMRGKVQNVGKKKCW